MFEITEFTECRLAAVTNRIEKHGDEDVPAVSLSVEMTTANTILDDIDPGLRHSLYKAVEGQDQLPGVEPATPVLRTNVIDKVALTTSHEGWRLFVDDGIDDTTPMAFGGVKVDKLSVDAKQGGSIVLKMRLGTSDVDAEKLGKLGMHNGQSIWVQLLKPEKAPDVIDGSTAAFEADHPNAGDLFAAQHGEGAADAGEGDPDEYDEEEDEGAAPDLETRLDAALNDGSAEAAELEAGMAQSIAAAGVAPKRRKGAGVR